MEWEPLRVRSDKLRPQFFSIANNVWETIQTPITDEMIRGNDTNIDELTDIQSEKGKYFRVYVTGGGCSGFQYGFKFDEFDKDEDSLLNFDSGVSIILDQLSYPYLLGSKIDFKEDLMGAKFTVENPNASSTCGCGASFSI